MFHAKVKKLRCANKAETTPFYWYDFVQNEVVCQTFHIKRNHYILLYPITYNCNVNMLIDLPNKRVSDWVYLKSLSQLWDTLRDNGLFSQVKSCSQLQNVGHLAEWGCLSVYWPVGLTNHSTQEEERWWYSFLCGLLQKWKMWPGRMPTDYHA